MKYRKSICCIVFVGVSVFSTYAAKAEFVVSDSITDAVIDVEYKSNGVSKINWKTALEVARVIPTLDGNGLRITLPNSDSAQVIILDKKGKRLLKSISYIAPAVINVKDLKKGEYQLLIKIHDLVSAKTFIKVIPKK